MTKIVLKFFAKRKRERFCLVWRQTARLPDWRLLLPAEVSNAGPDHSSEVGKPQNLKIQLKHAF